VYSRFFAVFFILLSLSVLSPQVFAGPELIEPNASHLVVKAPLAAGKEALISVTERLETTPEQIQAFLADSRTQNADIIISTDQEKVIEAVVKATSGPKEKRLLRIIPIGKLAAASQKIATGFKNYYTRAKNTLMHDRIGLTVLTITVGYDTMIWIHSASFDIHQKTAMVMLNLVMAATFGLDRDLWTKMTSPLKNKLIRVFDRFIVNEKIAKINVLTNQFLAGLIFGTGIQSIRTGLLSLDHLAAAVITTDFWLSAIKISALITATSFAWTEMYGAIDAEKKPIAKMMLKRLAEMRGLILCQLASISMVLQPQVYGITPVASFVVHGSLGLLALANADRIINFLESNTYINKIYKKVQTFENFINKGFQFNTDAQFPHQMRLSCQSLFSAI